jgi:DNA polymerase-3 subunit alpha (Gram-positive type)
MEKYIKDVFADLDITGNMLDAKIENVNLYKKQNRLQVDIVSDKPITINDIGKFESYLTDHYKVERTLTNIRYQDVEIEQNIDSNWGNIITYITSKEPLSKAMLTNSTITIDDDNNLDVNLKIKGAEFLCSKKFDKGLEHLLQNVYNSKYTVKIKDCLDDDYYRHIEQELAEEERKAVKKAEQEALQRIHQARSAQDAAIEAAVAAENASLANGNSSNIKKSAASNYQNSGSSNGFGYGPKSQNKTFEKPLKELPPGMIYGRSAKIKGTPIKVNDITTDTENVVIDGEVIRTDSNDMRSKPDKSILIFDLYDGSSTITCKAFVDKASLKDITKKIDGKRN